MNVLVERNATHGNFSKQAACSQRLKAFMAEQPNWERLSFVQREALESVALKISRILHGDHCHLDSWLDGAGYFTLGAGWTATKKEPPEE